ncbi:hypothetical protein [Lyngbya sp. CCY1209]|uniref:hypothetical protein n=1 Tax=Lyngbya sp. CCY1209 TaxID=2886103 RepID=UPI002D20B3CF|nr:hypothetical protein [Lyngbya sp. CCY1209]MEB3885847.1 hypothetical protein [Lyngbya sp. CCY1209]
MTSSTISPAQANLKMALWQIEADSTSNTELYVWLSDSGLSPEVALRLHEMMSHTQTVGQKVFSVGKIVLIKIIEFVKDHPFLVAGVGIGATVGAAVAGIITAIPFIGQLLAPIALALGITITAAGAVFGHNMDRRFQGVGEEIVEIATIFFKLVADVFNVIFRHPAIA